MEKLFYTVEEAAQRLGKSADEVREMARSGQLSEFRDRDRLMFRKEQVDLLAGGEEEPMRLADSGELEPIGLASSGTAPGIKAGDSAAGGTGSFNLLELESTDEADANAVTRIAPAQQPLVDPGEDRNSKSGSGGLLDLTREADDTSLGQNLLEDVYGSETVAAAPATDGGAAGGGALFETPAGAGGDTAFDEPATPAAAMTLAEPYDPAGSGLVGGFALGAALALAIAAFALIAGMTSSGGGLMNTIAGNYVILLGVCAGLPILLGIVGWLVGKRG